MRTKLVKRYYCDHCSRGGLRKPSMADHESRCFRNPHRKCEVCENGPSTSEAIEALNFGGVPALRERVAGCPACMMAAILQYTAGKDLNDAWVDFDYKKEKAEWDVEKFADMGCF